MKLASSWSACQASSSSQLVKLASSCKQGSSGLSISVIPCSTDVCSVLKDDEGQAGILLQQLDEKKREVDEG